jgi:fructose-1,6-bisphosphatase/inositol monophosphatase family enzyme
MIAQTLHASRKRTLSPFPQGSETFRLHRALNQVAHSLGRHMEEEQHAVWEGLSLGGDHVWSRNDLEATSQMIRLTCEVFAEEGLNLDVSFESEEISLKPTEAGGGRRLRLIIDPIDGSKAFDNWKCGGDCPMPRPASAISIAAVCPVGGETVASAVYCFDTGEVYSSLYTGGDEGGRAVYTAFRNETILRLLSDGTQSHLPSAKKRALCGNYNSKALVEIARLELMLSGSGLKFAYGGLSGSSATDIINVVRGSFCACIDVRALYQAGGSVLHWYDIAGALPIARGRGLSVIATDARGNLLSGADYDIYTPVASVVTRHEFEQHIVEAIRSIVCGNFSS